MTDDRERWALILGGSSGMGQATAITLAKAGYNICGIHLDFRAALAHVEEVKAEIEAAGVEALYINMNAADDEKRAAALATLRERFDRSAAEGRHAYVRVVMHSLAFGSLVPFISDDPKAVVDRKKMEMTQDVMANSLVYWVQDLYRGGFLEQGSKIYAMTSEGSSRVVPSYGVVSSAKAALESHIRQLAMELAQTRKGITANTIRAGVTMTPALMKIPEHDMIIESATKRNPTGRMTTPQDVANAILALSGDGTEFINGEVIGVDGGEFITGLRRLAASLALRSRTRCARCAARRRLAMHPRHLGAVRASLMSGRVIVVSSVNVDLVVAVERLPAPGETVVGGRFERHHGGKGGNQAVAAARLGAPTAFVGAIGNDAFGRDARDALAAERDRPPRARLPRGRGDGGRPDPGRRARREQHRRGRRLERGTSAGTRAPGPRDAAAATRRRRAGRPRDPDGGRARGAPDRPGERRHHHPQPAHRPAASRRRPLAWPTSSRRTAASWRPSPVSSGCPPTPRPRTRRARCSTDWGCERCW